MDTFELFITSVGLVKNYPVHLLSNYHRKIEKKNKKKKKKKGINQKVKTSATMSHRIIGKVQGKTDMDQWHKRIMKKEMATMMEVKLDKGITRHERKNATTNGEL